MVCGKFHLLLDSEESEESIPVSPQFDIIKFNASEVKKSMHVAQTTVFPPVLCCILLVALQT